uniref:Uncharacterized protein n=1 Tax=Arundo donax TaxID=35708 RepID=A0A0A9HZC3_ARUDO
MRAVANLLGVRYAAHRAVPLSSARTCRVKTAALGSSELVAFCVL